MILGAVIFYCYHYRSPPNQRLLKLVSPQELENLIENIMSVQKYPLWLNPNNSGSTLAYIRGTTSGRGVFLLNLNSNTTTRLQITNETPHTYGWSSDDQFLALSEAPAEDVNSEFLLSYDAKDNSISRLTSATGVVERTFIWLGEDNYYFSAKLQATNVVERYIGNWRSRTNHKTTTYLDEFAPMGENMGAFGYNGNIHSCAIDSTTNPPIKDLSHFTQGFDNFIGRWLRYSPQNQMFLFCSAPKGANWRYLYKYSPQTSELTKLNDEDTYNGQWLQDGEGYAFIGNRDNHFYLAVRPKQASEVTNLFVQGSVSSFKVSASGDKIYAAASEGIEPQGVWEYNLNTHALRCVVPGTTNQFVLSHLSEPREYKVESTGGVRVTYFIYPPPTGTNAVSLEIGNLKKHPVFINLPPGSDQAQKVWIAHSQLLANLGSYVVDVNYRGCDGYGKAYADLKNDDAGAAEDVMNVYRELLKDPAIDPKAITIGCRSSGVAIVSELLQQAPELWSAVLLDHPGGGIDYESLDPKKVPPLLITTGDQDPNLPWVNQFVSWAKSNGVKTKLIIEMNSGHVNWNVEQIKEAEKRWLEFGN